MEICLVEWHHDKMACTHTHARTHARTHAQVQKMLSYLIGTANDFYWGFKPVFRYSKPYKTDRALLQ